MKFVFDLDGTICFKGQPVTERILEALERLTEEGHEVIFASARPIRDMLPVLHPRFHMHTLIGGNGSMIHRDGDLVFSQAFRDEDIDYIKRLIEKYEATFLIDGDWDYCYTGPVNHPILGNLDQANLAKSVLIESLNSILKVLILTANDFEKLAEELSEIDVTLHTHRNEKVIDISPNDIDKWNALRKIGIGESEYIAFGNDANDITLFQHANHAVMIGHHEELSGFAAEAIPLQGDYEENIIRKLEELADRHRFSLA
ncbi:HAD-IIB family hydrolase [Bacillus sp. SG-1]|uniref:HAD-IIB family hydrolase n=1 Tax=Bacillus sp. SG-1 TaxID=161544 RepID=UPI00015446CF|nr:HAD-IIB family hydrolase [Bacillus sp. SG-1]EDL63108.1 putative hydrolase [Bacillus sp. SG-1]